MGYVKVVFDAQDTKEWLEQFHGNISNLTKIMKSAAALMEKNVFKHFDTDKKGSDGSAWPKVKVEPGYGDLLRRRGTLRQSLFKGSDESNAWVGNGLIYAMTHDAGDSSRNIPQREFMWIEDDVVETITNELAKEIIPE